MDHTRTQNSYKRNHRTYINWKARGKPPEGKDNVKKVQKEIDAMIVDAKSSYQESIAVKLCTSSTGSNLFWTAINRLIDKKKNCNIPPLLENNVFISSLKEKACIFNEYFANQCNTLNNGSELPFFLKRPWHL